MIREVAAEALFVSTLQPSGHPDRAQIDAAVTAMILLHGSEGCAADVAAEFGDHPAAAVERMGWCRNAAQEACDLTPA